MKKFLAAVVLIAVLSLIGCANMEQSNSSFVSGMVGLNRVITLYSADGKVIQQWEGRYNVRYLNGFARFMDNGKAVSVCGTISIIQK